MARYKCSDPRDFLAALDFINLAKEQNFDIELKRFHHRRSNPQNRYLHFALAYFAHCYGCTMVEAKEVFFKQFACRDIFLVDTLDKNGRKAHYFRSTTELTTIEMSSAINNFLAYASCHGIEIPQPDDELGIRFCEREIEKTQAFGT